MTHVLGTHILGKMMRTAMVCLGLPLWVGTATMAQSNDVESLARVAETGAGQDRYVAIDQLGMRREQADQVVPLLRRLLTDADPKVIWRSARALGDYGSSANASASDLRKLLGHADPVVQYHAIVALGRIGDRSEETVDALVTAATSQDGRVARVAIAALGQLRPGPAKVTAALRKVLSSNDDAVFVYALETLVRLGKDATPLLKEMLQHTETAYVACTAIEHIGPDAADTVPELIAVLNKTHHSEMQIAVMLALARMGSASQPAEAAVAPLLEVTSDDTVPAAAAFALGSMQASHSDAALRKAAQGNREFLAMVASWALAKIHHDDLSLQKAAVEKLVQGLAKDDPKVRKAAAMGLQKLAPPPDLVAPLLMKLVHDPDPEVTEHVVEALAGLGEAIVPRLSKALEKPEYRNFAVQIATRLGPKAAGAVDALVSSLPGADAAYQANVQTALAAIGPAAAPATKVLAAAISSNDQGVRETALYALRQIGPAASDSVPVLLQRVQADQSFDALAAAWAITRIVPGNPKVAAPVVAKLIDGLTNEDEQTRWECVDALAAWGQAAKPAMDRLKRTATSDDSEMVREAAQRALDQITKT